MKQEKMQIRCKKDSKFYALAERCAAGDADAMAEMGKWFMNWVDQRKGPDNPSFEERTANFWFYRAMMKGSAAGKAWLEQWEKEFPNQPIPGMYNWQPRGEIDGWKLEEAGLLFFKTGVEYDIDAPDEDGVVLVGVYRGDSGWDADGFGSEIEYDWYFLDENLSPIEGVEALYGWSCRDLRELTAGKEHRAKAAEKLKQRKRD